MDWSKALCREFPPDIFFAPDVDRHTYIQMVQAGGYRYPEDAVAVCRACEIREACLTYALEHREREGVWGGMTEHQRRRLLERAG